MRSKRCSRVRCLKMRDAPGFGVYIHWPFCAAKCPYCDFNSHVRKAIDHSAWRNALLCDLRTQAEFSDKETVTSIFFGGGTPSLMEPETVGALIDEVGRLFQVANNLEVTLEANPTSVEAGRFRDFRSAGVNRVSMGIQALNDPDLKALGRMHSAAEAMAAFNVARENFDRISFDLIYARQNQSLDDWSSELRRAIGLAVDHLSLYQLTIEAGTRFGDLYDRNKLKGLPSDSLGADMYDLTQEICFDSGLPAYEISNHAAVGSECLHNLTYWRYGPYLGVGPGAHGRVISGGKRYETESYAQPEAWLSSVLDHRHGLRTRESLFSEDVGTEYALMSLRLAEGLSLSRYKLLSGLDLDSPQLSELISQEYIKRDGDRISATSTGRPVLNSILKELLA